MERENKMKIYIVQESQQTTVTAVTNQKISLKVSSIYNKTIHEDSTN